LFFEKNALGIFQPERDSAQAYRLIGKINRVAFSFLLVKNKKILTLERRKQYNLNMKNKEPDHHEFANSD